LACRLEHHGKPPVGAASDDPQWHIVGQLVTGVHQAPNDVYRGRFRPPHLGYARGYARRKHSRDLGRLLGGLSTQRSTDQQYYRQCVSE
jgi:hypothetical protein